MRTRVDLRLVDEAHRFVLRFACEDCAHFAAAPARAEASVEVGGRCVHGYPAAPRRDHLTRDDIWFCKEFDVA